MAIINSWLELSLPSPNPPIPSFQATLSLWDCIKGSQPYCDAEHEHRALSNEDLPHAIVFVDGMDLRKQDTLSFKILSFKTMNQYCGVPSLSPDILSDPPWTWEEFDLNREDNERSRAWLFTSETAIPGAPWVISEQRIRDGITITTFRMHPNPPFERFTISQYKSPLYQDSVYWLNYSEINSGSWNRFLKSYSKNVSNNSIDQNAKDHKYNAGGACVTPNLDLLGY